MLTESVHYDERRNVCHLVEVEHQVLGGPDRLPVVEPADFWPGRASHTRVEAGHLPMCHRAACDGLGENGFVAHGGFLKAGSRDVPLRLSRTRSCWTLP